MMNILALSLVFTSIITAGILSPATDSSNIQSKGGTDDDVIVKEGHRVVVVEYENRKEGQRANTKILIQPPETRVTFESTEDGAVSASGGAKELICDAFGKCKEKLASVVGKGKEKVVETSQKASDQIHNVNEKIGDSVGGMTHEASEKVHKVSDKVQDAAKDAKTKAEQAAHKVSDKVRGVTEDAKHKAEQAAHRVSDKVHGVTEDAEDMVKETGLDARNASEKVYDAAKNVRGTVREKTIEAKDKVKEVAEKIPGMAGFVARDTVATSENLGLDVERNLTGFVEKPKEKAEEAVNRLKLEVNKATNEGRVFEYISGIVKPVLAVVHMFGFSMAYGTCIWVTFVSSYIMSRYVPTQQYGMIQSKLYGVYFKAMAVSVGTTLVSFLIGHRGSFLASRVVMFEGWNLLVSLITVLINLLYLGPQATKVMFERMKLEKDEGRGPGRDGLNIAEPSSRSISKSQPERGPVKEGESQEESEAKVKTAELCRRLKQFNTYSSLLNLATLMSLSWHLVYLGRTLSHATF